MTTGLADSHAYQYFFRAGNLTYDHLLASQVLTKRRFLLLIDLFNNAILNTV